MSNGNFTSLNLIGASQAFQQALIFMKRFACLDSTVLISGETGTGKELTARALHYLGNRSDKPFVAINCGASPEHLVESEFFGHTRGAFTDARETRDGLIATASGGTLFLDEIEAMSLRNQAVLLRFLQEKKYRPVGANVEKTCNARIVVASNCDLFRMVETGQFRLDLLHRINQLKLDLPPLRKRTGDVSLLAKVFVDRLNESFLSEPKKVLHVNSFKFMESYNWPGNVRELENTILREYMMTNSSVIEITELGNPCLVPVWDNSHSLALAPSAVQITPLGGMHERRDSGNLRRANDKKCVGLINRNCIGHVTSYEEFKEVRGKLLSEFEFNYLKELLTKCKGNLSLASRLSGRDRSDLCKLLKKYDMQRSSFDSTIDEIVLKNNNSNSNSNSTGLK